MHDPVGLIAAMVLSLIGALLVIRPWDGSFGVPFYLNGIDTVPFVAAVQGMIDHGWYFTNPSLGAPGGQDLIDFAAANGDNLQWAMLKALSLVTGSAAVTVNLYLLAGFPAVAGTTYLVLRRLGISGFTAVVGGVILSLLPYHFAQAQMGHHALAFMVAVPLGAWLVARAILAQPLMRKTPGSGLGGWLSWRNAAMVGVLVVVGGSTIYYAAFTVMLLVIAGIVAVAAGRSWRSAIPALWSLLGMAVVVALSLLPAVAYRLANGTNTALAVRKPFESEVYSLSLTQLLVPVPGHRIDALADLHSRSVESTVITGEAGQQLGAVLALGLVGGMLALCAWAVSGRASLSYRQRVAGAAATGGLLAFLVGTFGGVSSIIAIYVSPQLRVWSRLTPFVAMFSLVLVALALDHLRRTLAKRPRGRIAGVVLVGAVGVIAFLDQTTTQAAPAYQAERATWEAREAFVSDVRATLPEGAMVLQLPLVGFPESGPVGGVQAYDHLVPYLHAPDLRWSFGAMRGRDADWSGAASGLGVDAIVQGAAAAGFAGVWVDQAGPPDEPEAAASAVATAVGRRVPPLVSPDGRIAFYPLAGARERLLRTRGVAATSALAADLLMPVRPTYAEGFSDQESDSAAVWRWASTPATVLLTNAQATARPVRFTADMEGAPGSVVRWALGPRSGTLVLDDGAAPLVIDVRAPVGTSGLTFTTNGANVAPPGEGRDLRMKFINPQLVMRDLLMP